MCGRFSLGATIRVCQPCDLPNWPETPTVQSRPDYAARTSAGGLCAEAGHRAGWRRFFSHATGSRWITTRRPELYGPLIVPTGKEADTRSARFDEVGG